jgi:two-component system sensor kinase FixL
VKITLETPSHLPPARGDRVHLQQVLLNLILNGMDAMIAQPPEQRVLVVRVRAGQDHSLEVAVTDAGTGISPADKARVFEPFFTTKAQGMGMGLALSRTIIEAHGGLIRAENNATTGATFTFTLPRAERAEPIGRRAPLNSESKS